ncbi:hypothetical protein K9M48_04285 [Candidatus Gracilibacteria bacterium]|nr:hypothetical protein [Candidatus Gracilibacteria bacterium]
MSKLELSLSGDLYDDREEIKKYFTDLGLEVNTGSLIKKFSQIPPSEIIIDIGKFVFGAIATGVIYDLFKIGIQKIFKKFKNTKVIVRDNHSIMYNIHIDNSVNVIVIPDRKEEFAYIKTVDDLISYLKKENEQEETLIQK